MKLSDYLSQIQESLSLNVNQICFRGQAEDWPLLPRSLRVEFAGEQSEWLKFDQSRRKMGSGLAKQHPKSSLCLFMVE